MCDGLRPVNMHFLDNRSTSVIITLQIYLAEVHFWPWEIQRGDYISWSFRLQPSSVTGFVRIHHMTWEQDLPGCDLERRSRSVTCCYYRRSSWRSETGVSHIKFLHLVTNGQRNLIRATCFNFPGISWTSFMDKEWPRVEKEERKIFMSGNIRTQRIHISRVGN